MNNSKEQTILTARDYDVAVIGGGPAGMMAAGRAAQLGARVVLLEKNSRLGVKLLMTGHGRCNLTNAITNKEFIGRLGVSGKFLHSALSKFGITDLMKFFEAREVALKIEDHNRVFPESNKATDILSVLEKYLATGRVRVMLNSEVKKFIQTEETIEAVILSNDQVIRAKKFIFATGGKSYPMIGALGDGYKWAKKLGHTVVDLLPALTPLVIADEWLSELEGLPLQQVSLNLLKDGKKIQSVKGDGIVTANGLSGPVAHDLGKQVAKEVLAGAKLELQIDFFPQTERQILDAELQKKFNQRGGLMFKNSLTGWLPPKLIPTIIRLSGISETKHVSQLSREERQRLVSLMKEFKLQVKGVVGFDKANTTAGGVALNEVDPKTMRSKLISNLFLVGEVLDLDGPTGGYNLQICWTTGYVAGEASTKV